MRLNLSMKQSLYLILGLVIAGMALLSASGLHSLNQQAETSAKADALSHSAIRVLKLQNELMNVQKHIDKATPSELARLHQTLGDLPKTYQETLAPLVTQLGSESNQQVKTLNQLGTQYFQGMNTQLEQRTQLGLDYQSGKLGELESAAKKFVDEAGFLKTIANDFNTVRSKEKAFLLSPSKELQAQWIKSIQDLVDRLVMTGFDDQFLSLLESYRTVAKQVIDLKNKDTSTTDSLKQQEAVVMSKLSQLADEVSGTQLEKARQEADQAASQQKMVAIIIGVVVSIVAALIVVFLARMLTARAHELLTGLEQVAAGDLRNHLDEHSSQDEFSRLARGINRMIDSLSTLVGTLQSNNKILQDTSQQLEQHAEALQDDGQVLSQRSDALVSATEQISAAAQEIATTTEAVDRDSGDSHAAAEEGARVITQALQAMESIGTIVDDVSQHVDLLGKRSEEINGVMDLISEIAGQTNLLALNAAIEAARVGEHGRGFAVVADEVRSLAEQTVKAAEDINERIAAIQQDTQSVISGVRQAQERVNDGRGLGDQALGAIKGIESSSENTSGRIAEVRQAMQEVAETTSDMAVQSDGVAELIQRNTQHSQSLAAATIQLQQQAKEMAEGVSRFRL
ncbi:hypothetical protein BFW38_12935 [Terasakiispira papahanaumokuakeensis]|uniref:Chemotaxis protein n=1 Tax=Terasakiispira papahanaumokuakeensis TaxID=197479 RepID=A0A1E2VBI6_9GAMM|nr:methyl-accepting chemotaxis protein [Terasakiispira papahanaumokuakeensis]ODC04303.1 hypothetical protein BFW38_12935 [Terasakiispira papahanaumokuakeensis]